MGAMHHFFVLVTILAFAPMSASSKPEKDSREVSGNLATIVVQQDDMFWRGSLQFKQVNLDKNLEGTDHMNVEIGFFANLSTEQRILQFDPKNSKRSSFSAFKKPPGFYALYEVRQEHPRKQSWYCMDQLAPVFELKPGSAYLFSGTYLLNDGSGMHFRRGPGTGDNLADAQTVLDEHPDLKAKVFKAEPVAYIRYMKKGNRSAGCARGKAFATVD
jgi:hypothetical protein